MFKEPFDGPSLVLVTSQALVDEVLERARPSLLVNALHIAIDDGIHQSVFFQSAMGRLASCELVSKASKGPDIDLLGVSLTLDNLWRDPVWCADLARLSLLLFLREESTQTQISNLDFSVHVAE